MRGSENPKDLAELGDDKERILDKGKVVLRLYVTGTAPNSTQAIANINRICEECEPETVELEIIDIFEDPLRALEDSIIASPTLVKISPLPKRVLIGNLQDRDRVLEVLGLGGATR